MERLRSAMRRVGPCMPPDAAAKVGAETKAPMTQRPIPFRILQQTCHKAGAAAELQANKKGRGQ
ncbi:hypothetical protein CBM2595_A80558 [Cupriavidus taiwanensis]|nr:hypothetical protein CBM2595_A80558 [Cupriavidus taiwanensis]